MRSGVLKGHDDSCQDFSQNRGSSVATEIDQDNLKPLRLPRIDWSAEGRADALETLSAAATGRAVSVIDWYLREKDQKKRIGKSLRLGALAAATLAGILPSVAQI